MEEVMKVLLSVKAFSLINILSLLISFLASILTNMFLEML